MHQRKIIQRRLVSRYSLHLVRQGESRSLDHHHPTKLEVQLASEVRSRLGSVNLEIERHIIKNQSLQGTVERSLVLRS